MSPHHDQIERLYAEHHLAVLRFARARLRDPDLAEDVVSETFVIALRRADSIPAGAERAWLCGVAENVLRNVRRKEANVAALPGAMQPHTSSSTPAHDPPTVGPALSALPDTERAVLTMTAFEGLSSGEAAERLGLSPGSTRNVLVRARRNLALQLAAAVVLLVPFLFFLLHDRDGLVAPQAQHLAQSLDRAESLETDAIVRHDGTSGRYRVTVDRSSGIQHVTLPDGQIATGPIDAEPQVQPRGGIAGEQRRAAQRQHAPAFAALETITSGDLEQFLDASRRSSTAQRTTGSGADQVTVVSGTTTTHDDREVELRVTLSGAPAALRQLKVRPAGQPNGAWTTVDVKRWRVRQPTGGSPPPAGAPTSPPPNATNPPSASPPPAGSSKRGAANAPSASSERRASAPRISPATAARNRRELKAVPTFTGTTGAVLHVSSRTVSYAASTDKHAGRSYTIEAESWEEIGGGQRFRSIERAYDPASGAFIEAREHWRSPTLNVFVPLRDAAGAPLSAPTVTIHCEPVTSAAELRPEEKTALDAARQRLGELPRGRELGGRRTRQLDVEFSGRPGAAPPTARFHLDHQTGRPLERLWFSGDAPRPVLRTSYRVWEEQPAGGSAASLQGDVPDEFLLSKQKKCASRRAAPPPAAATPAPTTLAP